MQLTKEYAYNLGNNISTTSSDKAIEYFLLRDMEKVLRVRDGKHHDVIFIPDTFLFKGLVEKVIINQASRTFNGQSLDSTLEKTSYVEATDKAFDPSFIYRSFSLSDLRLR